MAGGISPARNRLGRDCGNPTGFAVGCAEVRPTPADASAGVGI